MRLCLCLLCVLCGGEAASAAVADYIGKAIGSVRLTIEDRVTEDPALTQVVETQAGQTLSMASVRESITHLFSLGRFENVRVDATLENGRVALRYELIPIHPVTRIRFAGAAHVPGIDQNVLRRAIVDRYGATPPLGRAADMARAVESALAASGYLHATATSTPEIAHNPDHATLVFTIDPQVRTTIGTVDLVGLPAAARDDVLRRLGLVAGAPYQRDRLNAAIERYVADRRRDGYYAARVAPAVTLAENDRVANVTLTVTPGPRVRLVFAGDPLPQDRRSELVPVAEEGSADEDLLEDSSNRIEEYLRSQGYRDAKAPHTREEANGELVITFTIQRGALYRVAAYDISGNSSIPLEELAPNLKIKTGQPFADTRLDADVAAIDAIYRRRGFASAKARSDVERQPSAAPSALVPVTVRISIAEGARTIVDQVTFTGQTALEEAALRSKLTLQPAAPFIPGQLAADRDAIQLAFQNLGYQNATVEATLQVSPDQTRTGITYRIQEGPRVFVDHVLIVGNVRTRTETIERELQVKAGDPYSLSAIIESQRRLTALGLFRRARISEVRHGSETTRDVLVTIEEAAPTTIGYGAGIEGKRLVDTSDATGAARERFDIAPRALFEVGRRNLFGKNRSANLFTSVSRSVAYSLTEYRAVATFREPRLFDTVADAFLNGTFEQQHRSSFDFARRSLSADVERRFSGPYRVTGTYQLQRTRVFNNRVSPSDQPLVDRTFPQYLLSSFSSSLIRDTRDDAVNTHDGAYASASAQLAGEAIGSEVGFVKSFFTAQLFRTVPRTRETVFAGSARLGVARGFSNEGTLLVSERFFAGGDSTNRGFALDQLGVRGQTIDKDGFAIGGNGLVLLNAELRAPVAGGLGIVGFIDTGNVFARVADIDVTELRSAVGGGIRYRSPVGPLRIDFGVKVKRQPGEGLSEWFVSFGQAF